MNDFFLSLRLARRDWRGGELRLLLGALIIAVAAVASVGLFADRMRGALKLQARQLLGADLVIASTREPDAALLRLAESEGLRTARTLVFPSMALAAERSILASVKAVSSGYPLRGSLRTVHEPGGAEAAVGATPAGGQAWVDPQLLSALSLQMGGTLQLGDHRFQITRVITLEPDRGANFINFAPRVMIGLDDVAATGLVQPASRVAWRLMVAGERPALERFESQARRTSVPADRFETVDSGRPELGVTLSRAERFLSLVALLTSLIAAVAIALGARRFAERHLDACAVMKASGLSQHRLLRLLLLELLWVGLAGALAGLLLGAVFHELLVRSIGPLINLSLPWPSPWPLLQAGGSALLLLLGFGAWPILRLAGVPPLRVLRREQVPVQGAAWLSAVLAVASFGALLLWLTGERRLAMIAGGGFAVGVLVFMAVAAGVVRVLEPLRRLPGIARRPLIRLSLASWSRRRALAVVQTASLAAGVMALLLLTVTRSDLVDAWRRASPPDAPDRFIINIQPEQQREVAAVLASQGVQVQLHPMVRGRLVQVNDEDASRHAPAEERAQRLIEREFNLSYASDAPAHNTLVAGKWFDPTRHEASAELGIMKTLGLKLGDRLVFDVAGEPVEVTVTSVRKLAWESMRANFFMILSPVALHDRPHSFLTAYRQPPGAPPLDQALVRQYPNLTVFDTGHLIRQVQSMVDQVVSAVQFLFVLTLAAGLAVLWGALLSSRDERIREAALMRALGASSRFLQRAQVLELALGGALAGVLGSAGALAVGWAVAEFVFDLSWQPRWAVIPLTMAASGALSVLAGWIGLRAVLRSPALASLRAA